MSSNIVHNLERARKPATGRRKSAAGRGASMEADRNPVLVSLGERVRALRAKKGISRKELSELAGVSERHLANLELGEGNASFLVLLHVAGALQCSMAELVGDFTTATPEWLMIRSLLEDKDESTLRRVRVLIGEALDTVAATDAVERSPRIALIGLRGAGKSTLGRMLAEDLGFPFVELSREIEKFAGCSIEEIQALYGINAYRRYERRALEESIQIYPEAIIATPGGIVSDPATLNQLLSHCTSIWIQASAEEHMQRVIDQGDMRPMAGNREAMEDLRGILDSRTPFYAQAQYRVDTSGVSLETAFNRLQQLVRGILGIPKHEE